jgi:hypothetical protein
VAQEKQKFFIFFEVVLLKPTLSWLDGAPLGSPPKNILADNLKIPNFLASDESALESLASSLSQFKILQKEVNNRPPLCN